MLGTFPKTLNFRTWHLHGAHDEEMGPIIVLLGNENFYLIRCRNSQNNRLWSAKKSHSDQQNALSCGWCIMSAPKIIWPIFWDHKFTPVFYIPTLCSEHLSVYWRACAFFQRDNGMAQTASSFMHCLECFGNRKIGRWLRPHHSPCGYYLWSMLNMKCIVIILSLKTTCYTACKISPAARLTKNIFVIFEVCQRSKDQNFQHLL